jgi:hypothetical protein
MLDSQDSCCPYILSLYFLQFHEDQRERIADHERTLP